MCLFTAKKQQEYLAFSARGHGGIQQRKGNCFLPPQYVAFSEGNLEARPSQSEDGYFFLNILKTGGDAERHHHFVGMEELYASP